eukprot:gnl/Chilomastix_cuspidata/4730.p1 GENE.gnl/Chilomastix_cuspidata/4730~~gnl/Chilomastix_cuspidata/4730.p1  ORF type:complete len:288 (+),score=84.66 gnl/Chilomastix_cuspidata/4730:32-865(+)
MQPKSIRRYGNASTVGELLGVPDSTHKKVLYSNPAPDMVFGIKTPEDTYSAGDLTCPKTNTEAEETLLHIRDDVYLSTKQKPLEASRVPSYDVPDKVFGKPTPHDDTGRGVRSSVEAHAAAEGYNQTRHVSRGWDRKTVGCGEQLTYGYTPSFPGPARRYGMRTRQPKDESVANCVAQFGAEAGSDTGKKIVRVRSQRQAERARPVPVPERGFGIATELSPTGVADAVHKATDGFARDPTPPPKEPEKLPMAGVSSHALNVSLGACSFKTILFGEEE